MYNGNVEDMDYNQFRLFNKCSDNVRKWFGSKTSYGVDVLGLLYVWRGL